MGTEVHERVTMPFDMNGLIETLATGVSKIPSAVIAAVLLGGPTAIWLITRFVHPTDFPKREEVLPEDRLWLCGSCLSINEERLDHCYRCHRIRAAESLPVVIHRGEPTPRIGVAVGPGLGDSMPAPGWLGGPFNVTAAPTQVLRRAEPATVPATMLVAARTMQEPAREEQHSPSPADPATIEPVILEPRVKVSTHAATSKPAGRRGRRQPQGAGEAN